ncbi:MAG: flagellar hook-basal body complex protein FliE [Phycisphaeraceae bacterium]
MSDPLGLIGTQGASNLHQMKQAGGLQGGVQGGQQAGGADFKDVLMENIKEVNRLQQDAEQAIEELATGGRDDVANVMVAKQKADLAFKMLLQVRNKMMDAYQEVKNLRV